MKRIVLIFLGLILIMIAACTQKSTELTQLNMTDLKVPDHFNYEMTASIDVDIMGAWKLPLYIKNPDGELILKAQMDPVRGLQTRLVLPKTVKQLVIEYQMYQITLPITNGKLEYNFKTDAKRS